MSNVINLSKGEKINLQKDNPHLKTVCAGLGWDKQKFDAAQIDLDVTAFVLGADGKVINGADGVVFYKNLVHSSGAIKHSGDNKTGDSAGDDETITLALDRMPAGCVKVQIAVTIFEPETRHQNFGQVDNAYCRIYDADSGKDLARYDLTEDYSGKTAVVVGEFYLKDGEWRFTAVGGGYNGGLAALCQGVGLVVE